MSFVIGVLVLMPAPVLVLMLGTVVLLMIVERLSIVINERVCSIRGYDRVNEVISGTKLEAVVLLCPETFVENKASRDSSDGGRERRLADEPERVSHRPYSTFVMSNAAVATMNPCKM